MIDKNITVLVLFFLLLNLKVASRPEFPEFYGPLKNKPIVALYNGCVVSTKPTYLKGFHPSFYCSDTSSAGKGKHAIHYCLKLYSVFLRPSLGHVAFIVLLITGRPIQAETRNLTVKTINPASGASDHS